jgi:hypothetical protein
MRNVVIIDIDGVLADYRLGLLFWIRQSCPELSQAANQHVLRTDTWIDQHTMGITYRKWLETLEMFRMSGGKQAIPVCAGAADLLNRLRADGKEIVLLTSRPIDIYSNIYRDTVEWLRNNRLSYDLLLWSKSKAEIVFKMRLADKALFAIDDELKHVSDYDQLGVATYWVDIYKKGEDISLLKGCVRVSDLAQITALL